MYRNDRRSVFLCIRITSYNVCYTKLLRNFIEGYCNIIPRIPEQLFLAKASDLAGIPDKIKTSQNIIVIFPLYTDCMPGIVMQFFEDAYESGILNSKNVGFIVQSGFPEALPVRTPRERNYHLRKFGYIQTDRSSHKIKETSSW